MEAQPKTWTYPKTRKGVKAKPPRHEIPENAKWCPSCQRVKHHEHFYRMADGAPYQYCRLCSRVKAAAYHSSEEKKRRQKEYQSRPEVKERRRLDSAERYKANPEAWKERRATPIGKCRHALNAAKSRLRKATDPEKRARIESLIAQYEKEIARLADPDRFMAPRSTSR